MVSDPKDPSDPMVPPFGADHDPEAFPDRRHVLLVSSDPDQLDMYALAFRLAGVAVAGTTSHDEAIRLVRDGAVSAVVVDVVNERDWQTCEDLVTLSGGKLPVTVLTGWLSSDSTYLDRAFRIGCAAYLAKPTLPETLQQIVERTRAGERRIAVLGTGPEIGPS